MANITSTDPLVVGSVNADEIHTDSINGSASTVIGGLGNDVYFIDAFYENGVIDTPADVVQEAFNEGIDTVKLDLFVGAGLGNLNPFFLFENVENLELNLSTTDPLQTFSLTGNSLANKISVLSASAGANASIRGGAGNDTLIGGAGNDTLNGGTDADSMVGGLGNDTYVVDSLLDKVTEAANAFTGGGDDLVQSTVNFSLGANIENLTLIGADNINGTGNALNNIMIGNNGNNIINGGAGNDNLNGGNGSDALIGGLGNDTLTGGAGSNRLDGGAGDDLYNISSATDIITDTGGGIDRVSTSVQLLGDLSAGIENLDLNTGVITGRGNALNNIINGNGANNVLFGLAGNDTLNGGLGDDNMIGGLGNDTYIVDSTADVVTEDSVTGGIDTVFSSTNFTLGANVENLTLTDTAVIGLVTGVGNSLNNVMTGNTIGNILSGLNGNDSLNGGAGADTMLGGIGNDTYYVDNALDVVDETGGTGLDSVIASVTFDMSSQSVDNVENLILAGTSNISGTGNSFANTITGNIGNNSLSGGLGNDTLIGGLGNDTLNGGDGFDSLVGGLGNDSYDVDELTDKVIELAGQGIDKIFTNINNYTLVNLLNIENLELTGIANINGTGNALNNDIVGNSGNNILTGGAGNDYLNGAAGIDTLVGGLGNDLLNGGADNDRLEGGDGADVLDGGLGDDNMIGGLGNDTYIVDSTADVVTEDSVTGGIDTVFSSTNFTLGANVENLTLTDTAVIGLVTGVGNSLNNVMTGNTIGNILSGLNGNDSLNGGAGADTMLGGIGNDTYYVDNALDVVDETGGTGLDSVIASVTFDMSSQSVDNVENLILAGTSNISGTGNSFANTITGNIGNNSLSGGLGNDTLIGGLGNDTLNGGDGFDSLVGGEGSDSLTGGVGIDTLIGGLGSDIYIIDDAGDIIVEGVNAGIDGLRFNIAGALSLTGQLANIEQAILTDEIVVGLKVGGTNIIGNNLNNLLIGNTGNNILDGGVGNDTLNGDAGNDSLVGGAGNDTLDGGAENDTLNGGAGNDSLTGGAGIDSLVGGLGNDIYVIDTADIITGVASDIIVEGVNAGIDGLRFNIAGALSLTGQLANIEQAILTDGFGGTNISGNNLNNLLLGNAGNNSVDGGAGNDTLYGEGGTGAGNDTLIGGTGLDTMIGGLGNDTYYVDNIGDRVFENFNSGVDSVFSTVNFNLAVNGINIENTQLDGSANTTATGNALNNQLSGLGSGNNKLLGGAGNDTLIAGAGSDTLTGGTGNDVFSIGQVSTGFLATALDAITDFTVSQDKLQLLSFVGLTFTGVGSSLTASQFHLGTAAVDADDFIIYNQATGNLYYDADGNGAGAQVQIFDFTGTLPFLSSTDIFG